MDRFGFAGLIELCRFGFTTLDLAAKYGMNRLIDSRNSFELIQRGFVDNIQENNTEDTINYDKEKYREMLLDAAETVLLNELKQEREKDIGVEMI